MKREKEMTFQEASKPILLGLTLNWILPFTIGDFIGRSLGQKLNSHLIQASIKNRTSSFLVSIGFALIAIQSIDLINVIWIYLLVLAGVGGYLVFKNRFQLIQEMGLVIFYSSIRYLIFLLQFVLLLYYFNPSISFSQLINGAFLVFGLKTIAPSVLGGLGLREAGSLFVFEGYFSNPGSILLPSLILWIINIVLPTFLGLYFLFKIKLNKAS